VRIGERELKITKMLMFSILLATFVIPMAYAEINIDQINIANVVVSTPPNWGAARFTIVAKKAGGIDEAVTVPVIINGTTVSEIGVVMKAAEESRSVSANTTFPGASILVVNPFSLGRAIPASVVYPVSLNPYMNPVSSVQYDVKVGNSPTKRVTVLVYADWMIWAIIIDIVSLLAIGILIKQLAKP
jgi:hypothetical protein